MSHFTFPFLMQWKCMVETRYWTFLPSNSGVST